MDEKELVKLLDEYMKNGGGSMKLEVDEEGKSHFITTKNSLDENEVEEVFTELLKTMGGDVEKSAQVFTDASQVDCPTCADVPNLFDIDGE